MVAMLVRRGVRPWVISIVAAVALLSTPAAAFAVGIVPGEGTTQPTSGSSSGSSGGSAQATVKSCSIYANPSGYGLSCVTPGSGGDAKAVHDILGDEPLPSCFDTPISAATMAAEYPDYPPVTGRRYYLHTCITGLDPNRAPTDQPSEHPNSEVITIVDGAPQCFNYDVATKKATPFDENVQLGHCVMSLTDKQRQVVNGIQSDDGQIPDIIIARQPSTRVRTNEDVAYVDVARATNGSGTRTPDLTIGGVTLWATMDSYKIYPYGPDGLSKTCDGTEQVGTGDTRATKPTACWWIYPKSSVDEPGMAYPFRAEADWTVHYRTDGVEHTFPPFQKYYDIPLPVYDIQTLVVR